MSIIEHPDILPGSVRLCLASNARTHILKRYIQITNANRIRTVPDRRRFQRVNIPVQGRLMRENKEEFACHIVDMSAGGIAISAELTAQLGERIIIYVENIGRLEGDVVRIYEDGFALKLTASSYKREKIVNQLTWLVNKDKLKTIETRQHNRFVPKKLKAKITFDDGSVHDCKILDMSLGGSAVHVEPMPEVGDAVTLGLTQGLVIRHTDNITNIQFLEIQDPATLERQFG